MSYEMRIGLLAVITIAVTVWGYKFMKGKNILNASNTYYVEYENINELTATSPVMIRGLRVGTVSEVSLSEDLTTVTAILDIDRGIRIHRETEALVVSTNIMGGKAIVLEVPGPCSGKDCAEPGDYLQGRVEGLFESMLGDSDMDEFFDQLKKQVEGLFGPVSDSLAGPQTLSALAQSFRNIQMILENLEGLTRQLDENMPAYNRELLSTLSNVDDFTEMLVEQKDEIAGIIGNLNEMTEELNEAKLGAQASEFFESTDSAMVEVEQTLVAARETLDELSELLQNVQSEDGTIGRMIKDDSLYTNLNSTARNLELLLQDFRLNPKRYVNVSVFGKKQKDYVVPETDPAFEPVPQEKE